MDMEKYYSQLVGAKIIGFRFVEDEYALEPFPVYTLQLGKQRVRFTVSQDEEGNGGGFVFIEETRMLTKGYVTVQDLEMCDCDEAQEEHEHCADCDCVLTSHESETLCRWCEERGM